MASKRRLAQRRGDPPSDGDRRFAVHPDKPLRRREEDDRIVAAPAMRVLVREIRAMQQSAAFLERLFNAGIRVEHPLPGEQLDRVEEMAAGADRRVDLETVPLARGEVVGAMSGRGVHRARSRVERDVVAPAPRSNLACTEDGGSGCARAARPSSWRRGAPSVSPVASATRGASASAMMTARPSTSYAA